MYAQSCLDSASPWVVAHQAPLIFQARILEWVAISSSRYLPHSGIELASLASPALAGGFFTTGKNHDDIGPPNKSSCVGRSPTACSCILQKKKEKKRKEGKEKLGEGESKRKKEKKGRKRSKHLFEVTIQEITFLSSEAAWPRTRGCRPGGHFRVRSEWLFNFKS